MSVFMRRIIRGRSPFSPDKTHIHHQLLSFGLNHTQSTGILILVNLLFVGLAFYLNSQGFLMVLCLEIILAAIFTMVLIIIPRVRLWRAKQSGPK
jgi:hypothetical protein